MDKFFGWKRLFGRQKHADPIDSMKTGDTLADHMNDLAVFALNPVFLIQLLVSAKIKRIDIV